MVDDSKIKEFPDISSKLTAPTKKSLFERQKAEAEAKRQREQEETAAVYEDFVKSFDDDTGDATSSNIPSRGGFGGGGGFSKRHFTTPSGPGGRGGLGSRGSSGPGSLGPPPPSLSRKRPLEPEPARREGLFAFEDAEHADAKTAFQNSDDEERADQKPQERAVPRPTLRLSSLPPGTSPGAIKAIIPATLIVEGVRILPPSSPGPNTTEKRSATAIVTLAKDTPALDIDTVVSALQNRYMGKGYYLSLSRHLSSASVGVEAPSLGLNPAASLPFGAKPIPPPNLGRAPPSSYHRGGFAPPASYHTPQNQYGRGAPGVQVTVTPPSDLKELKIIHKTLEALIRHGPEFEALLMSRKDVQLDEKWAWLWDSRSVGGVYYRWRLWDILTGAYRRRRGRVGGSAPQHIFENGAAWVQPEQKLPFEYATRLDELVSDSDYNSSEDEDSGDEGRRRYAHHHGGAPPPDAPSVDADNQAYLNPLQKAKLTHLLARLPTSNARLRRGDVARVTAFAIQHAGEGTEEVVQMIVFNVVKPFAFTSANPDYQLPRFPDPVEPLSEATPNESTPNPAEKPKDEEEDTTPAKLVALYVISDILSSSSTSGVRHAWRYRQLFEQAMKRQNTFTHLGRLEKTLNWGRLRAEKWKRSVNSILSLWEGWCVFPQDSQEAFSNSFNNPPLTQEEEVAKKAAEEEEKKAEKAKRRWKTVDEKAAERAAEAANRMDIDNVDGEPMDENLDGEPMEDGDLDGEPMPDSDEEDAKAEEEVKPAAPVMDRRAALAASIAAKLGKTSTPQASVAAPDPDAPPSMVRKRQRPKAEDMFASDEE